MTFCYCANKLNAQGTKSESVINHLLHIQEPQLRTNTRKSVQLLVIYFIETIQLNSSEQSRRLCT